MRESTKGGKGIVDRRSLVANCRRLGEAVWHYQRQACWGLEMGDGELAGVQGCECGKEIEFLGSGLVVVSGAAKLRLYLYAPMLLVVCVSDGEWRIEFRSWGLFGVAQWKRGRGFIMFSGCLNFTIRKRLRRGITGLPSWPSFC